jgi:hypothetical protein
MHWCKEEPAGLHRSGLIGIVGRFLGPAKRDSLKLWSTRFFSTKVAQLVAS